MNDACARARAAVVGGHTISDSEPKAGLAVVGSVDPAGFWSQRSAREGQVLVLTKALGTGIVGQAIRAGSASPALVAAATAQMMALNDTACAVGLAVGATSCTDVTGFGLLGHLQNLVEASGLDAEIDAASVPLLDEVLALAAGRAGPRREQAEPETSAHRERDRRRRGGAGADPARRRPDLGRAPALRARGCRERRGAAAPRRGVPARRGDRAAGEGGRRGEDPRAVESRQR